MKTLAVFLFLFWGLNAALAQTTFHSKQFGLGGELQLNPVNPPQPITSITWKHQGNIVAEYIKDSVPLEFLGILNAQRASLDLISGQLTISGMKKADEGQYTVEINNRVQSVGFTASEVKPVPEPEVLVRPLTCSEESEDCKLSCEPKPGLEIAPAEPVRYFWKLGDGSWELSEKDRSITNTDETRRIKAFSCKLENKIGEKESLPLDNPFNKKIGPGPNIVAGIIVGVFLLLCAGLVVLGIIFREKVKPYLPCFPKNGHQPVNTEMEHNGGNKSDGTNP